VNIKYHYLYKLDSLAGQLEAIVVEGYMGAPFWDGPTPRMSEHELER
jgi:hypothetical protein